MTSRLRTFTCFLLLVAVASLPRVAAAALPPFVTSWPVQPAPSGGGDPYAVAVDNAGYVYVVNNVASRVEKYTDGGVLVAQWGTPGTGDGQFQAPFGVAVDGLGHVYVADTYNRRIQKFTDTGGYLLQWGSAGGGPGQFRLPFNLAVDRSGAHIYVTDEISCNVQVFDSTGTYQFQWGSFGHGDGEFGAPYGIALNSQGNVYVSDLNTNCQIEEFTSTGSFITRWGNCYVNDYDTQDCGIWGIAVGPDDNVYAADAGCNMIKEFTPTGTLVFRSSATLASGCMPNFFSIPYGVAVDALGNMYVADTGGACIQKYGPGGSLPVERHSWGQLKTLYR